MPKRSRLKRNSSGDWLTCEADTVSAASSASAMARTAATRARTPKSKSTPDRLLELAPIDDHVEHAVLEQELAALEALGKLLPDGLLDDARTRRSR